MTEKRRNSFQKKSQRTGTPQEEVLWENADALYAHILRTHLAAVSLGVSALKIVNIKNSDANNTSNTQLHHLGGNYVVF